jgi:hypothetical protein
MQTVLLFPPLTMGGGAGGLMTGSLCTMVSSRWSSGQGCFNWTDQEKKTSCTNFIFINNNAFPAAKIAVKILVHRNPSYFQYNLIICTSPFEHQSCQNSVILMSRGIMTYMTHFNSYTILYFFLSCMTLTREPLTKSID